MTIDTGPRSRKTSPEWRAALLEARLLVGIAAALAVFGGGVMAFSYDAAPGDPLWHVQTLPVIKPMPVVRAPLPTPRPPQPRLREARGHEPAATRPY
ncbi:hypothetical protein [Nocardia pseudobrasiliensis]|uniref:Uncharacterized protein n=1 Tax=Nocardia pseudobrasiliensis TaxID=45979 RepID=A0A370IE00_9NOCA|nr:hypothetical protein [Nocardia pseudobrasiliensis]RDI68939.1 hypothetical protein DFR76_101475 [Nocardia pseudobrasiliensis]